MIGGGLEDPNGYDKDAYDKAVAMTIAAQEHLGIENLQPVPQSFLRDLSDNYDSKSSYQQDKNAKIVGLLAGTSGPVARAAVARQLADADLGWIMPVESGYRPMSTRAVLASQAKGLGKAVANAGIGAAELAADAVTLAADGNSQARINLPDFSGAYYKPANRVENLTMQQGSDALSWAIPWPAFGRAAVAERIPQAMKTKGAIAAEHAESLVANKQPDKLAEEGEAPVGAMDADETLRYQQGLASFAFPRVPRSEREFDNAMLGAMLARDPDTVRYAGAKLGVAESEDYRKTFFDRNPELKKEDNIVHHAGERQVKTRNPSIINKGEINSYENLRGIPKKFDRNVHKKVIRFEMNEFYKRNPNFTREQWLDKITEIDKKYGHLFNPPVGE
ncbi:MAG: hypothetical protein E5V74_01310 [Mesorhizobium sp.]|nr:MAG: hypothetical protein E5V86_11860 [Mesorhizobium sp.]TIW05823.1 MAG: hypothetical protein E5V74_01310 [Mesorhizobium sp.]